MSLAHAHPYTRLDSPIHRLPASIKLVSALVLIAATMLTPTSRPIALALPALILLVIAILSRLPMKLLVKRLVLLEPFVLGTATLTLFQADGFRLFSILVGKCSLCLFAMVLLSSTTPFSELLRVLQAMHVPALLITTISLMYRYLFVMIDEAQRMRRARTSRTFTRRRLHLWHTLASVVGQLFVRTSERAERIYGAMSARGWR